MQHSSVRPVKAENNARGEETQSKRWRKAELHLCHRLQGRCSGARLARYDRRYRRLSRDTRPEMVLIRLDGGGHRHRVWACSLSANRLKAAGIKLTVAVDQVAASGGYMMAWSNHVIGAPSLYLVIGVVTTIPVHRLLNITLMLKCDGRRVQTHSHRHWRKH